MDKDFALLPLTQGKAAIIDRGDLSLIKSMRVSFFTLRKANGMPYPACNISTEGSGPGRQKTVYLHQIILPIEDGLPIGHRNRNPLDCRRKNLRHAPMSEHIINQRKQKRGTKAKNVYWHKRIEKFQVCFRREGILRHVGYFRNFDQARAAASNWRREAACAR